MEHLTEYGVTKGSLQWNIASPAEIQKKAPRGHSRVIVDRRNEKRVKLPFRGC